MDTYSYWPVHTYVYIVMETLNKVFVHHGCIMLHFFLRIFVLIIYKKNHSKYKVYSKRLIILNFSIVKESTVPFYF